MRQTTRPLRTLVISAIAVVAFVSACNILVDPYGAFGAPVFAGVNLRKPAAYDNDRWFKARLARQGQADCLLAGSSRVGEGMDPADPALSRCRGVLDVSLAGPNAEEMTAIVELAERHGSVRNVVMSLDFFAFNATRAPTRGGQTALHSGRVEQSAALLSQAASLQTFGAAWRTVMRQQAEPFHVADGSINPAFLANLESSRPTRATFERGVRGYVGHILPGVDQRFEAANATRAPIDTFRRFLGLQHRRGVRLTLFFSPAHAWQWELKDALGVWADWERWRVAVLAANEEAARETGNAPFPVWDFVTYDLPSGEPVPVDRNVLAPTPSYWDNSHFKRSLGSRMLARMLNGAAGPGRLVDGTSIGQANARLRAERAIWRLQYPADVADVRRIVQCEALPPLRLRLGLLPAVAGSCEALALRTR